MSERVRIFVANLVRRMWCVVAVVGVCDDVGVAAGAEAADVRCCDGGVPEGEHGADLFFLLLALLDGAGGGGDQVVRDGVRGRPVRQRRRAGGATEDVVPELVVREHQLRHHAVGQHPGVRAGQRGLGVGLRRAHRPHGPRHPRLPPRHPALPPPNPRRQPPHPRRAGGVLRGEEMQLRRALPPSLVARSRRILPSLPQKTPAYPIPAVRIGPKTLSLRSIPSIVSPGYKP
jgi:hypothetical protein